MYLFFTGNRKVTGIFRVDRQNKSFARDMKNKYMLWHGTDSAHMISILTYGLQVDPPHARTTGAAFGKVFFGSTIIRLELILKRLLGIQNQYWFHTKEVLEIMAASMFLFCLKNWQFAKYRIFQNLRMLEIL